MAAQDSVTEAGKLFREAMDATRDQRQQIEEDLRFSEPSNPQQWDDEEKRARENDPGGARPCLVHDQIGQYVANVAGQVEQRPPGLHALPVDGGADRKVAEHLDGFFRHIEHASRASQHYATALTSAARAGVGYLTLRPEYTDRALNYQEPRIGSEGDPLRVVFDPWSKEIDGSDATFGFLLTPFSHTEFERIAGEKARKVSFGDESQRYVNDWRESILIAEMWQIEDKKKNIIVCTEPSGDRVSMSEDDFWIAKQDGRELSYAYNYMDTYRCVKWKRMSGAEIIGKETEYPASGIGIIPVYGYVGYSEGRMKYCGIPRRARDPQRAYNFHISETRALMATAPKAPWVVDKRAIKGLEPLWDRASVDSRAYLPVNGVDEQGNPIPPPQRPQIAVDLRNHQYGADQALRDIQSSIGLYQANLGAPSNETSGVAIDSRKQQGEASTAHFPSHLAASLGQLGTLTMEMVPKLIDTKRQMRILGIDKTPSQIVINPGQPEAMQETEEGISINPNIGKYDVRAVVGASFATQRTQTQQALSDVMTRNPALTPAIAPLWAQTLDMPNADKLAQVLTAMAPEPVKAILQPPSERGPSTAELMAQVQQLQGALQQATAIAHEAQQDADEANAKLMDKEAEAEVKEKEVNVKAYDAETKRIQALGMAATPEALKLLVAQTVEQMLSSPNPLPGDPEEPQPPPEAWQMQSLPAGQSTEPMEAPV